ALCDSGRFALEWIKESWIDQNPRQCVFNARVEVSLRASRLIEGHQRFHGDIGIRDWLPERPARHRSEDLFGAGKFIGSICRSAHENAPAACRVPRSARVEWTGNGNRGNA